jgi:hypothetical protein
LVTSEVVKWSLEQTKPGGSWHCLLWSKNSLSRYGHVLPDGCFGTTTDDIKSLEKKRDCCLFIRYWCDLFRVDNMWWNLLYPEIGTNPTFKKEERWLSRMGIKGHFIDVEGDGNCLYYCILHVLVRKFTNLSIMIGKNYPIVWIRKKIREWGIKFSDEYWTFFSESEKSVHLKHIFDPAFN